MALEKIDKRTGRAIPVPGDDIDTDRIIPARFMKCVTFDGLGEYAFYDERKNEDGSDKDHPMNQPDYEGASILLSGSNFGCGSSREHAPQSLYRWGIRAVIAESFAEIFFGNSIGLGIPCVCAKTADIRQLADAVRKDPTLEVTVDIANRMVSAGSIQFPIEIPESARSGLLEGKWDAIAELLEGNDAVDAVAARLSYV